MTTTRKSSRAGEIKKLENEIGDARVQAEEADAQARIAGDSPRSTPD